VNTSKPAPPRISSSESVMLGSSSTTRIFFAVTSISPFGRKLDPDVSSLADFAVDCDLPAVLLNDLLRVRHAEAEAAALGGIERLEDLFDPFGSHSRAGVFDLHPEFVAGSAG